MADHLAGQSPANYNIGSSDSELADVQHVLETNRKSDDEDAPRSSISYIWAPRNQLTCVGREEKRVQGKPARGLKVIFRQGIQGGYRGH